MTNKYAELFTAKLNDMGLVLFEKHNDWDEWVLTSDSGRYFTVSDNFEYFLCIPQHKDACLHWLNGGSVQIKSEPSELDAITEYCGKFSESNWNRELWCMRPLSARIKTKKEKRLIASFPWGSNKNYVTPESFPTMRELHEYVDMHYGKRGLMQIHEIEVEL